MAPYGDRVSLKRAGVWSHECGLKMDERRYRGSRNWALRLRECRKGEQAEVRGINVGTGLAETKYDRVSILKMDIEGAEGIVFSRDYESWLPFVDNIAIELRRDSRFALPRNLREGNRQRI